MIICSIENEYVLSEIIIFHTYVYEKGKPIETMEFIDVMVSKKEYQDFLSINDIKKRAIEYYEKEFNLQ